MRLSEEISLGDKVYINLDPWGARERGAPRPLGGVNRQRSWAWAGGRARES